MAGGSGGHGGNIVIGKSGNDVVGTGTITTSGALSSGIVVQSIGGGGGAAAVSSGSDDSDDKKSDSSDDKDSSASLTLGGSGGNGGYGGNVNVYAGSVTTTGFSSHGIVAQSIGGGGGLGASSGFAVKDVPISLGGGKYGGGGQGRWVTVTTLPNTQISTSGEASHGIVAQSIGGGGGLGMVALGTASKVNDDTLSNIISVTLGTTSQQSYSQSLFGSPVTVTHQGAMNTAGERAVGIVAQSIGGGGGFVTASEAAFSSVSFQSGQTPGMGSSVTVDLEQGASIVTTGDGGIGILAQSIGGGGGVAADLNAELNVYYVDPSSAASSYGKGKTWGSQPVTVSVDAGASILTIGSYAHGIVAQSVGGGGGIFERNGKTYAGSLHRNGKNTDSTITVTVDGSVVTKADNAWAIWAQSQDESPTQGSPAAVNVVVNSGGTVLGSTTTSLSGGAIYAAYNAGSGASFSNFGIVIGNVITSAGGVSSVASTGAATLGSGAASLFANQGSGTFVTGSIAGVGTLLNAGTMNIGGTNTFMTTTVTGDLVGVGTSDRGSVYDVVEKRLARAFSQFSYYDGLEKKVWRDANGSRGGLIDDLDLDMEYGGADKLNVRGNLSGTWGVALSPEALLPNTRTEFLNVQGSNSADLSILPSMVFTFTDPTTSAAGWTGFQVKSANFANSGVSGLSPNSVEVSRGLQDAWDRLQAGTSQHISYGPDGLSLAKAFGALHEATPQTFDDMLFALSSETSLATLADAPQGALAAASSVLSCPAFTTDGLLLQEGECTWGRFLGMRSEHSAHDGFKGYKEQTTGFAAGGQKALGDGWFLGGSLSYEDSWYKNDSGTQKLENQSMTGAAALKKEVGQWLFAVAGGASYNWGESTRYMTLGSLSGVGTAEPNSSVLFGRARASYELIFNDHFYMRPMVDLDVVTAHQPGYRERGLDGLSLIIDDSTNTVFSVTPGVEIGTRVNVSPDLPARLFAGAAVSFLSEDSFEVSSRFAGISEMDGFLTKTAVNDTVGHVTAGVDLQEVHGLQLKVQYEGSFADNFQSHGGSLRFGYRF